MGDELFQMDGRTAMMKLIVAYRNFGKRQKTLLNTNRKTEILTQLNKKKKLTNYIMNR